MEAQRRARRVRLKVSTFEGVSAAVHEQLLPVRYSPLSYNFCFDNGALTSKIGIRRARMSILTTNTFFHELPSVPSGLGVKNIHFFKRYDFDNNVRGDKIIIRCSDDKYYETSVFALETEYTEIAGLTAVGEDCSSCYRYNGKDVFLLSSEKGGFFIYDGETVEQVAGAPRITSMCVHYERIYATVAGEGNSVWFSDDFNPANWSVSSNEGGFINFDDEGGAAKRVVSFLDNLYIFRDYGIERLTAYAEQNEYSLAKVFVSSGRIIADTVAVCGDKIMFLAEDGIFGFSGYSVAKTAEGLTPMFWDDKKTAVGCFLDGKYYLACKLYFKGGMHVLSELNPFTVNNCLVEVNTDSGKFKIVRGVDVDRLITVKAAHESSVIMSFKNDNAHLIGQVAADGKLFGVPLPRYWLCERGDLGYPDKMKAVREVYLRTKYACTLGLNIDGEAIEFSLGGSDRTQKITVNRAFETLGFYIKSDASYADILPPVITVDLL